MNKVRAYSQVILNCGKYSVRKHCERFSSSSDGSTKSSPTESPEELLLKLKLKVTFDDENAKNRYQLFKKKAVVWEAEVNKSILTKSELEIYELHKRACQDHFMFYKDPITGLKVKTRLGHFMKKGGCCGKGCRHCAYEHEKVLPEEKVNLRTNSAFYYNIEDTKT